MDVVFSRTPVGGVGVFSLSGGDVGAVGPHDVGVAAAGSGDVLLVVDGGIVKRWAVGDE